MSEREFDMVIGIHSIIAALKNPERKSVRLVCTEDARDEIRKQVRLENINVQLCATHKVQEEAKIVFRELDLEYHRVPSGVFLLTSPLTIYSVVDLYSKIEDFEKLKILCLDQISDVHNAAAILRTASFYGVDLVIVPDKKSFGLTPSFFRIASGAAEYVPLYGVGKLSKTLTKMKDLGVLCLGLSEHAKGDLDISAISENLKGSCLVLGREDVGISNAVLRVLDHHISLDSKGAIKSLNVSTAAAISMEKCFS